MDILIKSKASLKGSITRIETFLQKLSTDISATELDVKLKKVNQLQLKTDEIRERAFTLDKITDLELNELESDLDQCETRLEQIEVRIKTFLSSNKKSVSVTENSQNETDLSFKTKIPPIILPTFSGKYEHYSCFKNQFDELITNNDQLTQSQKLYYLYSCLTNEVKEFASSYDTFSSLYEALESRFTNKRLIVDIHVQNILNFKKIERENALEIRAMIDLIEKNLRSLKILKYEQNDLFDIFLINIMLKKLDKESRKNFELIQKTKEVPTFQEFITFLEQREAVLLSVDRNCNNFEQKTILKKPFLNTKTKTVLMNQKNENKKCVICSKSFHPIFRCEKFLQLTPQKRFELVRLHKLCDVCFRMNHKKSECRSSFICTCGSKHSKLLCFRQADDRKQLANEKQNDSSTERENNLDINNQNESSSLNDCVINSSPLTVLNSVSQQNKKSVLLSTGNIFLKNKYGKFIRCRAIFDTASNINIISQKMRNCLGINLEKMQTSVSGLNSMRQNVKGKINTFISNEKGCFREPIELLVTEKITCAPTANLDISGIKIPTFLELADPYFYEAKEIDALLNADIFFRIMKDNVYKINEEFLFRETEFGWIAGGRLNETETSGRNLCFLLKNDRSLEETLKLFFELESLGIKDDPCIRDEDRSMDIFKETVRYNNGRYIVELPFRRHWKELANNFPVAKQRFLNLWRRLQRNENLYSEYKKIMQDYLNQGIIEKVENTKINDRPTYYLPHQAVKKEGRITTSTRIVFDAASHLFNELSLNDCLWPGPNLYPNLLDVLINFRLHRVAISSDIRQAFLQICIADHHKDALRFLWTDDNPQIEKNPNIEVYRFNRVIFGVNASPFLLAATIKHHIEKYRDKYPMTVQHLDKFMYVDDWITGCDTTEEALLISRCAKNIMMEAGMLMRKWISNDTALMHQWEAEGFDTYPIDTSVSLGTDKTKVLGITWKTEEDSLTFDTKGLLDFVSANKNTKRFILQVIGKIFDPLGLLTPFTIRMKCLIQELWEKKITWDENLPSKILERWLNWCKELTVLDKLKIPRLVLDSSSDENSDVVEIHTFCDASKLGYGAAVYLKVKSQNKIQINLVTSKSRVSPLKNITLPRLELLGALVAARLSSKVQKIIIQKGHCTVFHWTDSSIVLFWIKGSSKRWKQFVRNRVNEITNLTNPDTWNHCSGKDNPSDLLSRGLSAESLLHNDLWWHGPSFLLSNEHSETVCEYSAPDEEQYLTELKTTELSDNVVLTVKTNETFFDSLVNLSNRFITLIRILGFIFRFIHNCRNSVKKSGPLKHEELEKAENFLIYEMQKKEFSTEMIALESCQNISNKSKILNLSPFIDDKGIIRVGGRLENSQLPYSGKHPIILPSKNKLTEIIVQYFHEKHFHLGPQHLLFQVRQKFWPIHGRSLCKKIVHNCVICFRANPKLASQIMGNLPKQRVTPNMVFDTTGIDLCGPFFIKNKYQRKGPEIKVYVCLFICLVTKAIHLEIISDLTSQALIATLKRFISRRGKCHKIFSDNGSNMVGANRELKTLFNIVVQQDKLLFDFLAEEKIEWHFIPPRSPNWGGLWEGNIKCFKYHFKRVVGNSKYTYEELHTIVTQIEAILNSRPLTPLSSDIDDLEVLTPAHFLIGRPMTAIVEPSLISIETNRLNLWQKITKSVQTIWKKWSLSYLNNLQQKSKWVINRENLKIGDMVLIKEENLPPCKWLIGRIVALYPGEDKIVRVVDVKTCRGIYKRSISRLCVLPVEN